MIDVDGAGAADARSRRGGPPARCDAPPPARGDAPPPPPWRGQPPPPGSGAAPAGQAGKANLRRPKPVSTSASIARRAGCSCRSACAARSGQTPSRRRPSTATRSTRRSIRRNSRYGNDALVRRCCGGLLRLRCCAPRRSSRRRRRATAACCHRGRPDARRSSRRHGHRHRPRRGDQSGDARSGEGARIRASRRSRCRPDDIS